MLTEHQLNTLTDQVSHIYRAYQNRVIVEIARRLARLREQLQIDISDYALKQVEIANAQAEREMHVVMEKAAQLSLAADEKIYREAGYDSKPSPSPWIVALLLMGAHRTVALLRGLAGTSSASAQQTFEAAASIIGSEYNFDLALKRAVHYTAQRGLTTTSGARVESFDSAMQRTILTGINSTTGQLQLARMVELNVDLVEVSAHAGARNKGSGPANHEGWQGKIYSRTGNGYPDFVEHTGYGTGEGLLGWNCRHSFWPFVPGVTEKYSQAQLDTFARKQVTLDGKLVGQYDATQKQRYIERRIRYWKEQRDAMNAAGLDTSYETGKVRQWQEIARKFSEQTDMPRQRGREMTFLTPWTR